MPDQQRPGDPVPAAGSARAPIRLAAIGEPRARRRPTAVRTSGEELVFDLACAFPAIAVSAALGLDLTAPGALRAAVLWAGVWLAWQAGARLTIGLEPSTRPVRNAVFALAALCLAMGAAVPDAFGARGLGFAVVLAAVRLVAAARAAWPPGVAADAGRARNLAGPRGPFVLGLELALWLAGGAIGAGVADGAARIALWIGAAAAGCAFERLALSRSRAAEGAEAVSDPVRAAERGRLFLLVLLGAAGVSVGRNLGAAAAWGVPVLLASAIAAGGLLAVWQLRFAGADDAERLAPRRDAAGAPAVLLSQAAMGAGIVAMTAGDALAIAAPMALMVPRTIAALFAGPLLLVAGHAMWRRLPAGRLPTSHLFAFVALLMLLPATFAGLRITVLLLITAILLALCVWEHLERRGPPVAAAPAARR